jgi:hypothetical protein
MAQSAKRAPATFRHEDGCVEKSDIFFDKDRISDSVTGGIGARQIAIGQCKSHQRFFGIIQCFLRLADLSLFDLRGEWYEHGAQQQRNDEHGYRQLYQREAGGGMAGRSGQNHGG